MRTVLAFRHVNTLRIKKGTPSTFEGIPHPGIFKTAVVSYLFVTYPLLCNEISFANKFLQESAFDPKFGNRKHGIQERRRRKCNQFLKELEFDRDRVIVFDFVFVFDKVKECGNPASGFAVIFAGLMEMVFGFVFAFASNFRNFAMHGSRKRRGRNEFNFRQLRKHRPCNTRR